LDLQLGILATVQDIPTADDREPVFEVPAAATLRSLPPWLVLLGEWARHRAGALLATGVDFAVMIGLVEMFGVGAGKATAAGAFFGAITNFLIGRSWIFGRSQDGAFGQAFRYALVAAGGLLLNAGGEAGLVGLGMGYVKARVIVSIAISNLWHYPAHKFFVFPRRRTPAIG
jgi:putative flippase GtrA